MKTTITLLLILFTSIATFGQTTETRYYNGKYTKETALKKVNEYLKITQSDGRLKFVGGASSTYQIDGIWEQKINEKDKITVGIRYLIGDKSLSIEIISAVVAKDGNFIVLSPESTNEANRKAYDNQVNLYTKVPFDYLMINENITNPTQTTTTGSNTSGQTTETRYYNGKYTKETALNKVNEYITQLKNKGFNFTKVEGKSAYQFSGTWNLNNGANTTIEYVIGDNNLNVKLTKSTNKGMNITEIVRDEKHHLHGAVKALYDVEVLNYITKLFDYLQIKNNTTSNTSQTTTTAGSNTSFQTTETRYYNGRYDYDNGLSSKEVVLHKINSYINIKNKAGATFLKLEEKQDFLSGTWTIKSSQGNIVIALDYLIGDKSLTVKLKYLMVGSQVISKNHPKGEMRNLHNVAIENFILDLFKYLEIKNNTTSKQTTTTTASSNTLEQTTETRYYNGKYTKETALQKANDFFNRTNGEKITFTKMEKKSDYLFVGNWIIKGAHESLQSKIEYSFEDDGLKIKINEIVLNDKYGTLKMDKNHKDEAVRKTAENLYTSINDLYVKAVFVHLDINNNTLKKTTKTGSNTSRQSIEKDYSKDKITASYNENLSLYVRKINDATVYFYQDNSRINQPIHYEIIEDGKNLRLFTTYTKDYYSAFSLNDMSTDKLYPLTHRNGVFYLYIYKKNGTYSFTYQGKALPSAQYELYISKGDYTVVKVKSDNTIYLFKSDLSKAAISNSQAKGVLVHFADKNPIFVEAGKPTEPTKWKIEKENDKYYLINSSENKKHGVTDYEKSINWGIYTIN